MTVLKCLCCYNITWCTPTKQMLMQCFNMCVGVKWEGPCLFQHVCWGIYSNVSCAYEKGYAFSHYNVEMAPPALWFSPLFCVDNMGRSEGLDWYITSRHYRLLRLAIGSVLSKCLSICPSSALQSLFLIASWSSWYSRYFPVRISYYVAATLYFLPTARVVSSSHNFTHVWKRGIGI
jgi:hypothetical protein